MKSTLSLSAAFLLALSCFAVTGCGGEAETTTPADPAADTETMDKPDMDKPDMEKPDMEKPEETADTSGGSGTTE